MAVSPAGNVYVTYEQETYNDTGGIVAVTAVTVKYDTAGHFIWSQPLNDATGTNPGTTPNAIGLDANENVYVQVSLNSTAGSDGEIVKYNSNGVRLASFGRGQILSAAALHVDADGTCYFSGNGDAASSTDPIPPDSIVAKFNPGGSLAYRVDVTTLEGIGHEQPGAGPNGGTLSIISDSAGDAFVLQEFDQTGPHGDGNVISVLKLDPAGKKVFVTRYNQESDESGFGASEALAVSPSGDVYVTGTSAPEQPSSAFAITTIKYNSAGVLQWVAQHAGSDIAAHGNGMALAGDSLVVTGTTSPGFVTIAYVP
jgi:hypothetical protein